jgi:hypothetical protein
MGQRAMSCGVLEDGEVDIGVGVGVGVGMRRGWIGGTVGEERVRLEVSMTMLRAKAVPVRRWQRVQWQA